MLNTQPKGKQVTEDTGFLNVHSIFPTIQGEGVFAGRPATFVRLADCNLQCPWCDTEYTGKQVKKMRTKAILKEIEKHANNLVVITGGEPFLQNFTGLVLGIRKLGGIVQIETNGTLHQPDFPYHMCVVCCSPKQRSIHKELIPHINYYKYVAEASSISAMDGLPLKVLQNKVKDMVARPHAGNTKPIYLQPMDSKDPAENKRNQDAVVASCIEYGYTLCLQIHKIIGVE